MEYRHLGRTGLVVSPLCLKVAVVRCTGTAGYGRLIPLMVGVIAGELIAGLMWMVVGASYYGWTGQMPQRDAVFPG